LLLLFWWRSTTTASVEQSRQAAIEFLELIQSGQVDQAWESTSAEFKSFIGRDRLRQYVKSYAVLQKPVTLQDCQPADAPVPLLDYIFAGDDHPALLVHVLMASEKGEWKVERLTVDGT
jgi:hypothetical protein